MPNSDELYHQFDQATDLREQDHHTEALQLLTKALVGLLAIKDYGKVAETCRSMAHCYKHISLQTGESVYTDLMDKFLRQSLEIAQTHNLPDHIGPTYFDMAEVALQRHDKPQAINLYRQALELQPADAVDRGRILYHLGAAVYHTDQRLGQHQMLDGLNIIRQHQDQLDPMVFHVWESGCLMQLALALQADNPSAAKDYLHQAKTIIDADPKLIIRARQWQELARKVDPDSTMANS